MYLHARQTDSLASRCRSHSLPPPCPPKTVAGATSVRAPGTAVDVAAGGATRVVAPYVGAINVPGGRKMLRL